MLTNTMKFQAGLDTTTTTTASGDSIDRSISLSPKTEKKSEIPVAKLLFPSALIYPSNVVVVYLISFVLLFYRTVCTLLHLHSYPITLPTPLRSTPSVSLAVESHPSSPTISRVEQQLRETEKAYRLHIISTRQALMALEEENASLLHHLNSKKSDITQLQSENAQLRGTVELLKHHFAKALLGGFLDRLIWQNRVFSQTRRIESLKEEKTQLEGKRRKTFMRHGKRSVAEAEKHAMVEALVQEIVDDHCKTLNVMTKKLEEREKMWKTKVRKLSEENLAVSLRLEAASIQQYLSDEVERDLAARVSYLEEKLRISGGDGVLRRAPRVPLSINTSLGPKSLVELVEDDELTPRSGSSSGSVGSAK